MSFLGDAQLESLAVGGASDRMARTRSAARMKAIRKNICAFANDLPGHGEAGVLLIGVEPDGAPVDLDLGDRTLQRLADLGRNGSVLPLPTLVVQKRVLAGREIVVILVEPSDHPPVRSAGMVWVRVGPTVRAATADEERLLTERRRARNMNFDLRPARGARLSDLDEDYLRNHYLPPAEPRGVPEQNERPLEGRLRALHLVSGDDHTPVWGSLLAFARSPGEWLPGARVHYRRIDGERNTDATSHRRVLTGRLSEVLRELEGLLELAVTSEPPDAGVERGFRRPDYPIEALRQLARNALMHRSYETNAPVRVCSYRDRVEFHSPGGLYGGVAEDRFGRDQTAYRNPLVAEIMTRLGFAKRYGIGIPIVCRELERNGNPAPEFRFRPGGVRVIVRAAS